MNYKSPLNTSQAKAEKSLINSAKKSFPIAWLSFTPENLSKMYSLAGKMLQQNKTFMRFTRFMVQKLSHKRVTAHNQTWLARKFGVSRETVCRWLGILHDFGFIYTIQIVTQAKPKKYENCEYFINRALFTKNGLVIWETIFETLDNLPHYIRYSLCLITAYKNYKESGEQTLAAGNALRQEPCALQGLANEKVDKMDARGGNAPSSDPPFRLEWRQPLGDSSISWPERNNIMLKNVEPPPGEVSPAKFTYEEFCIAFGL